MTEGARGLPRGGALDTFSTLRKGVACSSPSRSQASAHVARRKIIRGRSASRKTNRAAPGGRAAGSVIVRSAPAKAGGQSTRWHGRTGSREPARPRNARERVKGDFMACREARSVRRRRRRGFPGWVARKGTTARRAPDDGPARGKDSELERRFVPARQFQGCRLRYRNLLLARAAQAKAKG